MWEDCKGIFKNGAYIVDEPPTLLGEDTAPNPSETLLVALGSCLAVGIHANAIAQDIVIHRLELEGDLNITAVWGTGDLNKDKPLGFTDVRVKVILESDATKLAETNQGFYPKEILKNLGEAGAYASFLEEKEFGLENAIQSIYAVSKVCGNTGFCVWCQNALAWYLLHSDNKELFTEVSLGRVLGGTGLSNPIKAFAKI